MLAVDWSVAGRDVAVPRYLAQSQVEPTFLEDGEETFIAFQRRIYTEYIFIFDSHSPQAVKDTG